MLGYFFVYLGDIKMQHSKTFLVRPAIIKTTVFLLAGGACCAYTYVYIYMVHPSQMSTSFCVDWHLRCFMHIVSSLFGEQSKFEVKAGAIYICVYIVVFHDWF